MTKKLNIGFRIDAPMPIDSRMQADTFNSLDLIPVKYDRMPVYVVDEDKSYRWFADVPEWREVVVTGTVAWGSITGNINNQIDLINKLTEYALVGHTHPPQLPAAHTHTTDDITDLDEHVQLKSPYSTGLFYKGTVYWVDNAVFSIDSGVGVINEWDTSNPFVPPVLTLVEFGPFDNITPAFLNTHDVSYIGIEYDSGSQIASVIQKSEPFSEEERRSIIVLGLVQHFGGLITRVASRAPQPVASTSQIHDFMESVGGLNLEGNEYTPSGDLTLNKSAGSIFKLGINSSTNVKNPHVLDVAVSTQCYLRYITQASERFLPSENVDPNMYDNGGTLEAVPAGKVTLQFVYLTVGDNMVQYGQNLYDSIAEAVEDIHNKGVVIPYLKNECILRTVLVLTQGATDLADSTKVRIFQYGKFLDLKNTSSSVTYDTIVDALGYVPENVDNKVTDLNNPNNITYPTTQAVVDAIGNSSDKHLVHTQGSAETVWTIQHNLAKKPSIQTYDLDGNRLLGIEAYPDNNTVTVTYISANAGIAILN